MEQTTTQKNDVWVVTLAHIPGKEPFYVLSKADDQGGLDFKHFENVDAKEVKKKFDQQWPMYPEIVEREGTVLYRFPAYDFKEPLPVAK